MYFHLTPFPPRSFWIIGGILLHFSEVDVWPEPNPVWVHVWSGGAARGRLCLYVC